MRDVLADILRWSSQGKAVALATVVRTWGSSPRIPGSKMAVSLSGEMAGSVSAGCVESAVVEEALSVLKTGRPKSLHYGVADDAALEVGLACGGEIDIFVEPLAPLLRPGLQGAPSAFDRLRASLEKGSPIVRATVIRGRADLLGQTFLVEPDGTVAGSLTGDLRAQVLPQARAALTVPVAEPHAYPADTEIFLETQLAPPTLVVVGAVHIGAEVAKIGKLLGFRVVIVDPRRAFGTAARFPEADQVTNAWPDKALQEIGLTPSTAVTVLSHDPKIDDPALLVALRSDAFYVGALGSERTQRLRRERLLAQGITSAQLARMRAPIGLALGGRAPEEIALSILAEIVAVRSGSALAQRQGPSASPGPVGAS